MLTEIQKRIVETNEKKVYVDSAAAAGKTAVLTERIRYLLEIGVQPDRIVAITFTNNAASVMYERLGRPSGLFIGTVHSYCNYLLRCAGIDTSHLLNEEKFDELFPLIEQHPECIKKVDALLLDEAQDSTEAQFRFFELINPFSYMYLFDLRQGIYQFAGADPDYLINKMHSDPEIVVYKMKQNHRNYPDILHFAKRFLYRLGPSYEDDSVPMRKNSDRALPTVIEGDMTPSEAVSVLLRMKEKRDTTWGDWFVLCRTNADVELFKKLLTDKGVPVDSFKQAELTNSEIEERLKQNSVKVLTAHSAKGLESNCVLVFNVRAYKDEEARLCYVAATRARDLLIWARMPKKKKSGKGIVNWE